MKVSDLPSASLLLPSLVASCSCNFYIFFLYEILLILFLLFQSYCSLYRFLLAWKVVPKISVVPTSSVGLGLYIKGYIGSKDSQNPLI